MMIRNSLTKRERIAEVRRGGFSGSLLGKERITPIADS
jgi:hypothetical protein